MFKPINAHYTSSIQTSSPKLTPCGGIHVPPLPPFSNPSYCDNPGGVYLATTEGNSHSFLGLTPWIHPCLTPMQHNNMRTFLADII